MTFGLVIASFSLPEWQAVKMTFFAHCPRLAYMHSAGHRILSLQPSFFYFGNDLIYFITDYCQIVIPKPVPCVVLIGRCSLSYLLPSLFVWPPSLYYTHWLFLFCLKPTSADFSEDSQDDEYADVPSVKQTSSWPQPKKEHSASAVRVKRTEKPVSQQLLLQISK